MTGKKDIILFVSIFCVLALISGSTFAYWGWESGTNNSVVFNTSHGIEDYVVYDAGDSHFVGDFKETDNFCSGMSNTISFSKLTEVASEPLTATINMDVNYIGSNVASSNDVFWVLTEGSSSITCDDETTVVTDASGNRTIQDSKATVISSGTFYGKDTKVVKGSEYVPIALEANIPVTTETQTFTIWIWINSAGSNLSSLSGETIDVNVWTQIDMTSTD